MQVSTDPTWPEILQEKAQAYGLVKRPADPRKPHELAHGGQGPPPLTAAEVLAHPEYPHTHWDLKPDQKDKVEVAKGRGGPLKIAYEIHGHGPSRIIVCATICNFIDAIPTVHLLT